MSPRDLLPPLFRCRGVLVLTFLSVFAVATLAGLRLQKYDSHLSIVIGRQEPTPGDAAESTSQTASVTKQEVDAAARLLKNRELLQQVVLANRLENEPGSSFLSLPRTERAGTDRVAQAVEILTRQLRVQTRSKSRRVEVTYSSLDPGLAYGVLNSLRIFYLEKYAMDSASDAHSFAPGDGLSYKAALDDAEAGLSQFLGTPIQSAVSSGSATGMATATDKSRALAQTIGADGQRIKPGGHVFNESDLEREAKADEQNYLSFLSRRERERSAAALDRKKAVTVTSAALPTLPASPAHRRSVIVLIALALATFVSLPAAIIVDCLDHGFHSADEVMKRLGIGVVLAVPGRTGSQRNDPARQNASGDLQTGSSYKQARTASSDPGQTIHTGFGQYQ